MAVAGVVPLLGDALALDGLGVGADAELLAGGFLLARLLDVVRALRGRRRGGALGLVLGGLALQRALERLPARRLVQRERDAVVVDLRKDTTLSTIAV